jgi:hypothetical protein
MKSFLCSEGGTFTIYFSKWGRGCGPIVIRLERNQMGSNPIIQLLLFFTKRGSRLHMLMLYWLQHRIHSRSAWMIDIRLGQGRDG